MPRSPKPVKLKGNCTYLVVGGLGGLGRAIIRFLAHQGAKHIFTLSRSGAGSNSKKLFVKEMQEAGVNLTIQEGSVVVAEDIQKLVKLAGKRPIQGIIQGAMVLQVRSQDG